MFHNHFGTNGKVLLVVELVGGTTITNTAGTSINVNDIL